MKKLITTLFLVSACTASTDDAPGGGDDDGGGADDGGGDDGGGTNDPGDMTESATVRFLFTTVRDERGDTIDFASGEPRHAHVGPAVTIGGTNCADVYKYAYLMSRSAPAFGGETTANPLRWQVELKNTQSLDVAASVYRVRTAGNEPLSAWRPLPALSDSIATIDLVREDIPALGERSGELFVDIRTVDNKGVETITSACWIHHPLAAPLEVQPARMAIAGLAEMDFAKSSPISKVFSPGVRVFSQRFVHHTAEPVSLAVDVATPVATYMKRAVDDYVTTPGGTTNFLCASDFDGFESDDPMCNEIAPVDPPDSMTSGALANVTWSLQVIEEATAMTVCTVSSLSATCELPARAPTSAATAYRIEVWMSDTGDLAPSAAGPFAEHTLAGATFTGKLLGTTPRCTMKVDKVFSNGTTATFCRTFVNDTHFHALDQARITFEPLAFTLAASPTTAEPPSPLPYVSSVTATVPATTWDAGDDDLPGPQ